MGVEKAPSQTPSWQFSDPSTKERKRLAAIQQERRQGLEYQPPARGAAAGGKTLSARGGSTALPALSPRGPPSTRDHEQQSSSEDEDLLDDRRNGMLQHWKPPRGVSMLTHQDPEEEEKDAFSHGRIALPTNVDSALADTLVLMAMEDLEDAPNGEMYESQLLSCEARLRRLNRLGQKLKQPNPFFTACVFDLLHSTIATLPPVLRKICEGLTGHLEEAVYSDEPLKNSEIEKFKTVVSSRIEREPHFLVAKRQQARLEDLEKSIAAMQKQVDDHLMRRRHVLEFIIRLQKEERLLLMRWLFSFWSVTTRQKRERISKLAKVISCSTTSASMLFVVWRLYVSQQRHEKARNECNMINIEATTISTSITQTQLKNEESQKTLVKLLEASAYLKGQCEEEEQATQRLQKLWDATQPELLMSVLLDLLDFFFRLLMRTASLTGIEIRRRLIGLDLSPLLEGLPAAPLLPSPRNVKGSRNPASPKRRRPTSPDVNTIEAQSAEFFLQRWLNHALRLARLSAQEQLDAYAAAADKGADANAGPDSGQSAEKDNRQRGIRGTTSSDSSPSGAAASARQKMKGVLLLTKGISKTMKEKDRLEAVVNQPDITQMDDMGELSDSVALCALLAIMRAERDRRLISPADLWPIDERDLHGRAQNFCTLTSTFSPDLRTSCLLSPDDIVDGNTPIIISFLATLFLKDPMLLTKEGKFKDEGMTQQDDAERHNSMKTERQKLHAILSKVEAAAQLSVVGMPEDPTPLLHGGEDVHALATLCPELVLLRWINIHLQDIYDRPVENFGSDLQDGVALSLLLTVLAPEVTPEDGFSDLKDDRLEQICAIAIRCTDFELLTPDIITDVQSDVIAAFLAQLFLSRSQLWAKPGSLMAMHVQMLESTCAEGFAMLEFEKNSVKVMEFCNYLEQNWTEITLAVQVVEEACKAMQLTHSRMRAFAGDTLAQRAYGRPRVMLDTKEARELLVYTSLNQERLHNLMKDHSDTTVPSRIEDLLRKHFKLMRDVFRFYATQNGPTMGITLEGLLKLYQDCKLRSKDLAPHHLEAIFYDQLDGVAGDLLLAPQNFILVLLEFANIKFRNLIDNLPDMLSHLIENHLKPYACQEMDSIFQRMAYDPKVRDILEKHKKELQIIFQIYATADVSTSLAMQRVNTMNIKEFQLLLIHTEMLDDSLTETAVEQIFEGIQQSAGEAEEEDEAEKGEKGEKKELDTKKNVDAGIDDDDELAYSEFIDGLVAVAAYKHPDPFTPFSIRVNSFILSLFGALRRHWSRKRVSPQVDEMLNILLKKLRSE